MNILLDLDSANRGSPKPRSRSPSGCGLDCQEELFGHLADRSQLCILQTLCEGAKTDVQIATATGLSQRDISFNLEHLLGCGCVKAEDTGHLVLYGLNAPRLLQLEGILAGARISPDGGIAASALAPAPSRKIMSLFRLIINYSVIETRVAILRQQGEEARVRGNRE